MKRGIAALLIFLVCIAFSFFCAGRTQTVLENTGRIIEKIKYSCRSGELNEAKNDSMLLKEEWEKHRIIIETTLDRSAVKDIEDTIITLPVLLVDGNTDKACEQCNEALCEIAYLIEKEKVSFENVF